MLTYTALPTETTKKTVTSIGLSFVIDFSFLFILIETRTFKEFYKTFILQPSFKLQFTMSNGGVKMRIAQI